MKSKANVVIAGLFPAHMDGDGNWEVVSNSLISEKIMEGLLVGTLGAGAAVERVTNGAIKVTFPVTAAHDALLTNLASAVSQRDAGT